MAEQSQMVSFMLDKESYYMDADELDRAMAEIDRELSEDSSSWEAWAAKADVLYLCNLYRASAMCCDKALILNPEDPLAWNTKGNALWSLGRYEEANECYSRAVRLEPILARIREKRVQAQGSSPSQACWESQ